MASVAQLRAKLTFDDAQFNQGIKRSTDKATKFAGQLRSVLAGGAVVAGIRSIANEFDRIGKLGKRFDVAPESLQRLGVAAQLAGSDLETVARGMNAMTRATDEASQGIETYSDAFARLNIDIEAFSALNADQRMLALSKAVSEATDAQQANADVMQIMGSRAGAELIPMLKDYEGLAKSISQTSVVSKEDIAAIEAFNDAITRLTNSLKVLGGKALGGALREFDRQKAQFTATAKGIATFAETGSINEAGKAMQKVMVDSKAIDFTPGNEANNLPFGLGTMLKVFGNGDGPPAATQPAQPVMTERQREMQQSLEFLKSIDRTLKQQSETSF